MERSFSSDRVASSLPPSPTKNSDSAARPADISIPRWNQSAAWIDIAVVNPICSSRLIGSAQTSKFAVDFATKNKQRNADLVKDAGVMYIPFVFDVYGTLNDLGHQCLQRISSIAARKNGKNWKTFYREARSKLVCAVLSNTARQIVNVFDG